MADVQLDLDFPAIHNGCFEIQNSLQVSSQSLSNLLSVVGPWISGSYSLGHDPEELNWEVGLNQIYTVRLFSF